MWSGGVDEAFSGAGAKAGLDIWCIENLRVVHLPKSSHGKFLSGSAYIVLNTAAPRSGIFQYNIHYWVGKDAEEDDSTMASDKAIELDAALGSRAVHYKEVQGSETTKFLSYFKPCIIPIEGVFTSEVDGDGKGKYRVTLLACKGDHAIHVKEVPFSRSSLNHNNVFILDTESKIFLFSGCNSSIQERAKALEVVQYINENQHGGRCKVATIEDGKFVGDSDAGEFWSKFGGYAPITRESPHTKQNENQSAEKLYWVNKHKLLPLDYNSLNKGLLSSDRCYLLDCHSEIFVWMGRTTLISERKTAVSAVEEFMQALDRPVSMLTSFLTEGSETAKFKSYFIDWPQMVTSSLYTENLGKVAAIFKNQGYDVEEILEDDYQPIIDSHGILSVWRVNCQDMTALSAVEQGILYSGNCYMVKYVYSVNDTDNNLFYAWIGSNSTLEDKVDAISLMIRMTNSVKGPYVMAQIAEGYEPQLFFAIFQSVIILKGRFGPEYKPSLSEHGSINEIFDKDRVALFRVQGSSPRNMQAIQVEPVSGSLNSSYCYILQEGIVIFTWLGSLSSPTDLDLVDRLVELINPLKQCTIVREGNEPEIFWNLIGGKVDYPRDKDFKEYTDDPHLFTCIFEEGDFKMHGNSFERKLAILKGSTSVGELPNRGFQKTNLWSAQSIRKTATSNELCIRRRLSSCLAPTKFSTSGPSNRNDLLVASLRQSIGDASPYDAFLESSNLTTKEPSKNAAKLEALEVVDNEEKCNANNIIPYELLKVSSGTALANIDVTRREAYLSNEEFQSKFKMNKKAFYLLPKWKQSKLKQDLNLF